MKMKNENYVIKNIKKYAFNRLMKRISNESDKNIAIYGAGQHTVELLDFFKNNNINMNIIGIIDNDESNLIGQTINGIKIYNLSDLIERLDIIIISSHSFENVIFDRIKNVVQDEHNKKIIKIYDDLLNVLGDECVVQNKIIFNRYSKGCVEDEATLLDKINSKDNIVREAVDEYIRSRYKNNKLALFDKVEIETVNRCNNTCSFCPINRKLDTREYKKMDEELFKSIIDQLAEINYGGSISLYSNNEPLLDDRIFEFNEYARRKLPNAHLYLFTNAILLNLDKFKKLMKTLDLLIIDNYNDELKLIKPVKEVYDYCIQNDKYLDKVQIHLRKLNEMLTTRGGQAKNRSKVSKIQSKCQLPFTQLIIRPTGEISLCCNDALGKYSLGNVETENLLDIWYGTKFENIRQKVLMGRENIELCKNCDTFFL